MIPQNELKGSNWVLRENQMIQIKSGSDIDNYLNYDPVPVTHDIMKKCGFDTMDYEIDVIDWAIQETEKLFSISQNGIPVEDQPYLFEYENGYGDDIELEVKSLHQLQNLYFAITMKELEYKP